MTKVTASFLATTFKRRAVREVKSRKYVMFGTWSRGQVNRMACDAVEETVLIKDPSAFLTPLA